MLIRHQCFCAHFLDGRRMAPSSEFNAKPHILLFLAGPLRCKQGKWHPALSLPKWDWAGVSLISVCTPSHVPPKRMQGTDNGVRYRGQEDQETARERLCLIFSDVISQTITQFLILWSLWILCCFRKCIALKLTEIESASSLELEATPKLQQFKNNSSNP